MRARITVLTSPAQRIAQRMPTIQTEPWTKRVTCMPGCRANRFVARSRPGPQAADVALFFTRLEHFEARARPAADAEHRRYGAIAMPGPETQGVCARLADHDEIALLHARQQEPG